MGKFQIVCDGLPVENGPRFDAAKLAWEWIEMNSRHLTPGAYSVEFIVEGE